MRIPSGVTDQYIYFVGKDAANNRLTGLGTFTVYRSRNGGAAAAFTTPTINETDATNMPGVYELLLDEDMTIDAGDDSQEMCFHITHAGMTAITRTIELYRPKITVGGTLTVASGVAEANAVQVSGSSTAANNFEIVFDTDFSTAYDSGNDRWKVGLVNGAVNATTMASAAITNATFSGNVGSTAYATNIIALAVRKALDEIGLDHLVAVADNDDVVDNAIIAKLASKAATANWSDFVNTTDSLQAIRDKQTDIEADTADIQTQVGTAGAGLTDLGGMSTGMKAEVEAESNDALVDLNLDHLMKAPVSNRDTMPEVVDDTVLANIMTKTDGDTSDFDHATDSLEAISDRISSVMTDFLNVTYLIPPSIDLADTATVRLGISLTNSIDNLPSTAEITDDATITIDRKAVGGTSWTNVVDEAALLEIAGFLYYDEVFDSTTGYADGDSIRITFKSVKVTVGGNDLEVIGSTGRIFYTSIREQHKIAGGYACTITLKNAGGTAVIEGASFWLSTSSSGTPVVGTAQRTDTNGQAVWWLSNGTYYGFATAGAGYTYSNDDSFTVASAAASKTFNYGTQVSGTDNLDTGITGGLDSFLVRCVDEIRMLTDEPEINAKYSNTRLIQYIESAYAEILQDAQRNATTAIKATYTFDYDADILFYDLPETCGTVLGVYVESANERRYFFGRGSELSGYGPGVTIQNDQLRFQPGIAADGEEITVNYLPNGCARLFSATTSTYDNDADPNTITASVVNTGYLDPRANVYRGYLLRVLTAAYAQTRVISSHTTSGAFSVRTEFDPELVGEVNFEICPELPLNLDMVVASKVAMTILGNEGNTKKFQTVKTIYTDRQRTIMLALTNKDYDYGNKIMDDGRHQRGGSKRRRQRI